MTNPKFREITWTDDDVQKMSQLQALGESIRSGLGEHCGPIGARNIAISILRSERAAELAPLLPWLLMRKLGNHIHEQDDIVPLAIRIPALGKTLKPILPELLADFVYDGDTAGSFLSTAHGIAKSKDTEYIAMTLPLLPEALRRASWATQNFGNLACDFLDMGGSPDDLIGPVKAIFESQQDDAENAFCRQTKEAKLAKHLCSGGFIYLLNHPRVKESKELTKLLQPYSGHIILDDTITQSIFRTHIYVLACIQGNRAGLAWAPSDEYARYTSINYLSPLKGEFLKTSHPADIAEIAIKLFGAMGQIPRREINALAHRAVKTLKSEFGQAIKDRAEQRIEWKKAGLDLVADLAP